MKEKSVLKVYILKVIIIIQDNRNNSKKFTASYNQLAYFSDIETNKKAQKPNNKSTFGKIYGGPKNKNTIYSTKNIILSANGTPVDVFTFLSSNNENNKQYSTIGPNILKYDLSKFETSRTSTKSFGEIKAYAANTHQGTVR